MFGHEFHALLIFQEFLIADDFAALFGFFTRRVIHLIQRARRNPLTTYIDHRHATTAATQRL